MVKLVNWNPTENCFLTHLPSILHGVPGSHCPEIPHPLYSLVQYKRFFFFFFVVLEFNVTLLYLKINYCDTRRVPSRYPLGNMGNNDGEIYRKKKKTMGN